MTPKAGISHILDDTKGWDLRYWMTPKAGTSQILDDTKGWDLTDTG
jgi:hypothetical protein